MKIIPVTFRQACAFVKELHRHNKPPVGHKFSIGAADDNGNLVGVAMAGRGVYNYAQDASTDVLCMSYAFDDDAVQTWTPDQPFPS
jgi:hypothetical protein